MTVVDPVAWLALVVSCVASFFAWRTAVEARRQADAVIGELPPTISLYQPAQRHSGGFAVIALEIVNNNRRPLYVERWQFDFPDEHRIFQAHQKNERQTLFAIFDAVKYGKKDFTFDLSIRLPGSTARNPSPQEVAVFNISTNETRAPGEPLDVSVKIWYRLDGDDQAVEAVRSMTWRPVLAVE